MQLGTRLCDWSKTNEVRFASSRRYSLNGMIRHNTQTGAKVGGAMREQEIEKGNLGPEPRGGKATVSLAKLWRQ